MIELKLSQGAKPGHGGILPAAKVTAEIAAARGVPMGKDCISPAAHSAFHTPIEMMQFIERLRELSGGKPVGFKLCIGHPWEWFALCKAMMQTDILPDFIVVDGSEGGTGAAPVEFADHVGAPLQEGLLLVHNTLVGRRGGQGGQCLRRGAHDGPRCRLV
jgi:glutamate synthase domain-containing protein 2